MRAEIISIGTELLLGHTINSDAAIVAARLAEAGIDVTNMQTVGDNAERLEAALELAQARSQLIITTGGLGPTDDDLSKETVARFCGRPLVEYPQAAQALRKYFGSRPVSKSQAKQTMLPEGSILLPNNLGTAPGCVVPFGVNQHIVMLPGPPAELTAMLESLDELFLSGISEGVIHSVIIRTFGIGEGAAAEIVRDLMKSANPTVAPYASGGEMFIKVTAKGPDLHSAKAACAPAVEEICTRLGDVVYGTDVESLEAVVVNDLIARGLSVATAESCTGGLLAKRITDCPGASEIFSLGVVTYANAAKEEVLAVPPGMLAAWGAVSPQVAKQMAVGIRMLARSTFGVGITGIAGPAGGTPDKPVGLVYIALADKEGCRIRKMEPLGAYPGRSRVRERAASHALDMLRRILAGLPEPVAEGRLMLFRQPGV